jgi:L-fucose mutarotase/ribose pyranase (RbsD/FucU family)
MGHRNWIVVADSAYPQQSSAGILTLETGLDHEALLKIVVAELKKSKHVHPISYTDAELKFVPEKRAKGVDRFRKDLAGLLKGTTVKTMRHEDIIKMLDEAGKTFTVLILKSNGRIAYSSVFFNLDCAYWGPDAEKELRQKMGEGE